MSVSSDPVPPIEGPPTLWHMYRMLLPSETAFRDHVVGAIYGDPRFTDTYFNMSQGPGDERGPWNDTGAWNYVSDRNEQAAVDGGDGSASVQLTKDEMARLKQLAARTKSDPSSNPVTANMPR